MILAITKFVQQKLSVMYYRGIQIGVFADDIRASNCQSHPIKLFFHSIKQKHSICVFLLNYKTMSVAPLTLKESVLLKKLISKITKLSQFMQEQGLSLHDVNDFLLRSVFEVEDSQEQLTPKLSKDFSSETEQETNSEASDCHRLEITMEKVMLQKVTAGVKMDKILIGYLEKCCEEEDKLKNYLKSEQVTDAPRQSLLDFDKFKQKLGQNRHRKSRYESNFLFDAPQLPPTISNLSSIRDRIQEVKRNSVIEESEREMDYLRSFEKSLSESIRKTKLLRSMLEKQLASEFSPLSLLRGEDDDIGRGEIY